MHDNWREIAAVAPELFVPDVNAAVRYYSERLGFDTWRVERNGERAVFAIVTLGSAILMFAHESLYGAMGGDTSGRRGACIDIRIMVEDVNAVHRLCRENDVAIVHDIADRYYGLRDFVIADLNGFRLRFASALR